MTTEEKLFKFAELVTREQQAELVIRGLDCEPNNRDAIAHIEMGRKYARVDVGYSGKFMVEIATERIYGIKAYGVIHRGHYYGTLDTTDQYYWGRYYPVRKVEQKVNEV